MPSHFMDAVIKFECACEYLSSLVIASNCYVNNNNFFYAKDQGDKSQVFKKKNAKTQTNSSENKNQSFIFIFPYHKLK